MWLGAGLTGLPAAQRARGLSRKSSGARGAGGRVDQAARAGAAAPPSRLLRQLRGAARAVVSPLARGVDGLPAVCRERGIVGAVVGRA